MSAMRSGVRRAMPFVVVMGVAGSGKSLIGLRVAEARGASFIEADAYHSASNIEKMGQGIGLSDEDRWPWLSAVCDAAAGSDAPCVIACSALKRIYRRYINERLGNVQYLYLSGTVERLQTRLQARQGHFARAGLLASQIASLEAPDEDERAIVLDIEASPDDIVRQALAALDSIWGREPGRT